MPQSEQENITGGRHSNSGIKEIKGSGLVRDRPDPFVPLRSDAAKVQLCTLRYPGNFFISHKNCKPVYIFLKHWYAIIISRKLRDHMENQETYLNTDAWSSSFVESNLKLWEKILDARNILCLPVRTIVFSQGSPAKYVYVVQRGRIVLSVSSPAGGEKVLMYAGVGCIIGEQALITGMEYSYQAVTLEESCFYRIPASLFRKYLTANTDVSMAFIFNLLNKDQSLMAHIADLSFKNAKHRLIRELLFCARSYGRERDDGVLIRRIFSQEDLGKRILASRVTVNKLIQELERQGLLHYEGRRMVLEDVQKLEDMLKTGEK